MKAKVKPMSGIEMQSTTPHEIITAVQDATAKHIISIDNLLAEGKHSHWLKCLDSDNFAIFVKTWFAFLDSVHQLVMIHASEEQKVELELSKGDKRFLDEFKSLYHLIKLNDLSTKNITDVFQTSRQVIFDYFPQYYYQTYFKKIVPKDIFIKEPYKISVRQGVGTSYNMDVKLSEKNFSIGVLFADDRILKHIHNRYVCLNLEISKLPDIHLLIDQSDSFYDYIRLKLNNTLR